MTQKILYVLAETGDFWSSRLPLALAAQARGCEIHLAAPGASSDSKLKAQGFTGHDLPLMQNGFSPLSALKTIFALRKILQDLNPDLVHTITLKYSLLTGIAMRGMRGLKTVYTIAGLGYLFSGHDLKSKIMLCLAAPFLKHVLRNPDAVVTFQNSDDMNILVRKNFVAEENCVLIPGSGVDIEKFSPRAGTDNSLPPLVLMPTRLVRDKGVSVFIEMAKILEKRQIPARFQVAGGVTDHNPLAISKEEMQRMVAGTPVEWIGRVDDMPALYAQAALIAYPSWYREGIPRVLLEAAAMGKACVTTDHPGCREAVAHNENGLLVPVKDAEATADAVEKILTDSALQKKMEISARARAEREFATAHIVEKTIKIYRL
ncbi:MAG: glycosyltransferase family 4 protein [Alphaproteobacteria bacterium]